MVFIIADFDIDEFLTKPRAASDTVLSSLLIYYRRFIDLSDYFLIQ